MAARKDTTHSKLVRERIQTSQLINRLQDNAIGEETMTAGQIRSAEILLRKSVPDLQAIEMDLGESALTVNLNYASNKPAQS
jgi:hypothetical protein